MIIQFAIGVSVLISILIVAGLIMVVAIMLKPWAYYLFDRYEYWADKKIENLEKQHKD